LIGVEEDEFGVSFEFQAEGAGRDLIDARGERSRSVGENFQHRAVEKHMQVHGRSGDTSERRAGSVHAQLAAAELVGAGDRGKVCATFGLQKKSELVRLGAEFEFQFRGQIVDAKGVERLRVRRSLARD